MRLRSRRSRGDSKRICFVTDVHGSERCFRKFLNTAKFYDAQYLILGGDITGKSLVPIEREGSGWRASFNEHDYRDMTDEEMQGVAQLIRDSGQYPIMGDRDELLALFAPERRDETFRTAVVDGIRRWTAIADERLAGTDVQCYVTPGNDDYWEIDEPLKAAERVRFVEGTRVRLDERHEMITTGYSNITPWHSPRELPEAELAERIKGMFAGVEDPEHLIAVLHPPPYGTELDQAPLIDGEFRVQTEGAAPKIGPVGSTAVRDFILESQPLLSLHGHVHESQGAQQLGRTLCLNPGSEYTAGSLSCAIVTLSDGRPEFQFTTG
jgi:Icc-related predicted phosphoesterase